MRGLAQRRSGRARAGWTGATAISTLLRSMALTTPAATSLRRGRPQAGGGLAPESANIPASRTNPGATSETPDAGAGEVGAQAEREAAQAELGGVVDRGPRAGRLARRARRRRRAGRRRARASPGRAPARMSIGASRLTRSARGSPRSEKLSSLPVPGSPALATRQSTSPASAASRSAAPSSARSASRDAVLPGQRARELVQRLGLAGAQDERRAPSGEGAPRSPARCRRSPGEQHRLALEPPRQATYQGRRARQIGSRRDEALRLLGHLPDAAPRRPPLPQRLRGAARSPATTRGDQGPRPRRRPELHAL